ncbi:MAG TPA: coenzyme F430 synthase [Methanomicrobiales archaeon]|nr:coenzyme F430 synthase [Methanomicrobiales archaeon]
MEILVLDTIHGGTELAGALARAGHRVDTVDVYRGEEGIPPQQAARGRYDLLVAPVHLDPSYPLLSQVQAPRITHHGAVRMLLSGKTPHPMVEVTGARGKTTTAHAIAHGLKGPGVQARGAPSPVQRGPCPPGQEEPLRAPSPLADPSSFGPGILHTSPGTFRYPERRLLWRRSITPASVIPAAAEAAKIGGWLVAEESLGVTGAGDVAVLSSAEDYRMAAGRRSALAAKLEGMRDAPVAVVPEGVRFDHPRLVDAGEAVTWDGERFTYDHNGIRGEFRNPLGELDAYRSAISLAAAALCALGIDPAPLATFAGVEGRLSLERKDGVIIVDNSNSGTTAETTDDAASYARAASAGGWITLVIGEEDRTVCEGFPPEAMAGSIRRIHPDRLILVGERGRGVRPEGFGKRVAYTDTLEAGRALALRETPAGGAVVLAVKTWR